MPFPGLRHYLQAPTLERSRAAGVLRGLFAAMFLGQMVVASLVAVLVRLASRPPASASPLLAWVLVAVAVFELPLGLGLANLVGRGHDRRRALSAALFGAVVLSTPAWLAAFALATGQGGGPLLALAGLLALGYVLGTAASGRLAARAAQGPPFVPR